MSNAVGVGEALSELSQGSRVFMRTFRVCICLLTLDAQHLTPSLAG